ncbi:MAG: hypothetical protein NTW87_15555 [Planctomycetota bacterium]|nr:hypothetical protein [Planctomycetota bacterium]
MLSPTEKYEFVCGKCGRKLMLTLAAFCALFCMGRACGHDKSAQLIGLIESDMPLAIRIENFEDKAKFSDEDRRLAATHFLLSLDRRAEETPERVEAKRILVANLRFLTTDETKALLKCIYLRMLLTTDPRTRTACLYGLADVDPANVAHYALICIDDKEPVSSAAAELAAAKCNSEVLWKVLQLRYSFTKGKPEYYPTNGFLEANGIAKTWEEVRRARGNAVPDRKPERKE